MKIGDVVKVVSLHQPQSIGILIRLPRKMFMASGKIADVMIDGEIRHVKSDYLEVIDTKGAPNESL